MEFTREQVLEFATNWKIFHANGLHKKKEKAYPCGYAENSRFYTPPRIEMKSDMRTAYYIMYNYIRGLPLDRGFTSSCFDIGWSNLGAAWYVLSAYDSLTQTRERLETDLNAGPIGKHEAEIIARRRVSIALHEKRCANGLAPFQKLFGPNFTLEYLMEFLKYVDANTKR